MQAGPKKPFSVAVCHALIRGAAQFVPAAQQAEWKREWFAEVWYRWRFLQQVDEWKAREQWRLVRSCLGAFADAGWHFASQGQVQSRLREWARSPWMCLGMLTALVAIAGFASGGFPATRQLLFGPHAERSRLLFFWMHPVGSGGEKGLPPDVAPAWAKHSGMLETVAAFTANDAPVSAGRRIQATVLVVRTEPALFQVFRTRPMLGAIFRDDSGVVLGYAAWVSIFHSDPKVIGSAVRVDGERYRIEAVLPRGFEFLTRQPSVYVVQHDLSTPQVMVIARTKPGFTEKQIARELTRIAEDCCYYFLEPDLRMQFLESAVMTPLRFFGIAVAVAMLMLLGVSGRRVRRLRMAWQPRYRAASLRRWGFFLAKASLALTFVFTASLEWSRSPQSFLFASKDPGSGPFLVWLYILGAMGVLSWSLADQRARCRVCLRLLCFPVRIGCPGCLLLDWSGTESVCAEGHGVLHVPLLAPSWDEEAEHWIALDESWKELFAGTK